MEYNRRSNIYVIAITAGEEKEDRTKTVFEEIMAELPKFGKT